MLHEAKCAAVVAILVLNTACLSHTHEEPLLGCLVSISNRHFITGRTLVALLSKEHSLPQRSLAHNIVNLNKVEILLLRHLHEANKWSILFSLLPLTYSSVCTDSYDQHGSYMFVLNKETVGEFDAYLKLVLEAQCWDGKTIFIAVIDFTDVQEMLLDQVLQVFKKNRINNSAVVFMNSTFGVNVLTLVPNQFDPKNSECADVLRTYSCDEYLKTTLDVFCTRGNLNGCPVKIATTPLPPFIGTPVINSSHPIDINYKEGSEIKMLGLILQKLNATPRYISTEGDFFSETDERGNITGYAKSLKTEADVAVGLFFHSSQVLSKFDVTNAYYKVSWRWYIPCPMKSRSWESIIKIFSNEVWLSIILALIVAALVVVCIANKAEIIDVDEHCIYKHFSGSILSIWAMVLGVGVTLMPFSVPLRILIFFWLCYSLAIDNVFQSFLTSFLIEPIQIPYVNNFDELLNSREKYGYLYFMDRTFESSDDWRSRKILKNRILCTDIVACSKWIAHRRNFSMMYLDSLFSYYSSKGMNVDPNGHSLICQLTGGKVNNLYIGMAMPKGSPLLDLFNCIIDRTVEAGIFMQFMELIDHQEKLKAGIVKGRSLADDYCDISLVHLQGVFYLLLFGHGVSLVIFAMEILISRFWFGLLFSQNRVTQFRTTFDS
ncbi:Ionotropic receptor 583 [Blattella germanica]|nr:Ionotropic receptor 583 [Blattella germanica]